MAVAAVLVACVALVPFEKPGPFVGGVLALIVLMAGVSQIRLAQETPPSVLVTSHMDPGTLPLPERMRYFRRQLILSAVVFPTATAWVVYTLGRLESGEAKRVTVWWPIAFVYKHFGYWPAVLALPVLGLTACGLWLFRLNKPDWKLR